MTWDDGRNYIGEWKQGKLYSKGKFCWKNGICKCINIRGHV